MEKRTAHYPLDRIKSLVKKGAVYATGTALRDAKSTLDYEFEDMLYVVENLEAGDLYKSMTTGFDNRLWQDVYHYPAQEGIIYIKLQIVSEVVIISFKEK